MKIEVGKFSFAVAAVASAIYALCSLFVYLFPKSSQILMDALTHTQGEIVRQVNISGFALGVVQAYAYAFIFAWLLALLLNRYSKQ